MSEPIDTPFEYVGEAIFLILWGFAFVSWFYALWESIAVFRLRPSAFERGRLVLSLTRELPHPQVAASLPEKITTATGQFRFVSPTECLFSPRFSWFGFRLQTPFPIKGRIRFSGSHAQIEGRAPLGATLFLGSWILAWPIIPLLFYIEGQASLAYTLRFVGVGVGAAFGMVALSLFIERRRAHTILREIEEHLRRRAA